MSATAARLTHNDIAREFPQSRFTVSKQRRGVHFVAELSDFGSGFPIDRIYADACDVGLALRTERGNRVVYYLADSRRDADGDVTVHVLRPTPESLRAVPDAHWSEVHLLND